jgi:hypothetical protein
VSGAFLCGAAGAGAVTAPACVQRRLGRLTALVSGGCDVDRTAGRGRESKGEAQAGGMDQRRQTVKKDSQF